MERSDWRLGRSLGLGGGEFRLPVLMYVVGYPARTAVPLNLAVSLVTLTFALVVGSGAVSLSAVCGPRHAQPVSAFGVSNAEML